MPRTALKNFHKEDSSLLFSDSFFRLYGLYLPLCYHVGHLPHVKDIDNNINQREHCVEENEINQQKRHEIVNDT